MLQLLYGFRRPFHDEPAWVPFDRPGQRRGYTGRENAQGLRSEAEVAFIHPVKGCSVFDVGAWAGVAERSFWLHVESLTYLAGTAVGKIGEM